MVVMFIPLNDKWNIINEYVSLLILSSYFDFFCWWIDKIIKPRRDLRLYKDMWHPFMTARTYMSVVESALKQQWSCIALRPKNRSKNKSIEYAIWPFLDNEVDVPEGHVLDLWLPGQQGDQGGGELLQQGVVVVRLLGQQLQELHQHLDGGQNHRRVGVGQPGGDALTDAWGRSRKKKVALGRGGWSVTTATAITLEVEYIFYWWSCPHVFQ